ncbi:phosphotransferase family protein [Pontiella sp.]|uniref:phosphotransferase family protein n=2 Tax=Pontiella sp. TaxID=2837462 RepID=UPI00356A190E
MNQHFTEITLKATGAAALGESEVIQRLWSGYGKIVRVGLEYEVEGRAPSLQSVVVKHVHWPDEKHHPRGWNTGRSHERKVTSYQVETAFYEQWANRCDASCRVPHCLALETHGDEVFMVMEDLDASGFGGRRNAVTPAEIRACLSWLAHFHAEFMGQKPVNLWPTGTYWHLETRPDELAELDDPRLKAAASAIDRKLGDSRFQTFVHGDAKLANFCFAPDGRVAAVDFQYVGGGCGMKDVAYFLGSCLSEGECERQESALLDCYFAELEAALSARNRALDFKALEADWRALYPVAWTDFFRFLQGWSPGHWKIHRYSRRLANQVLDQIF